MPASLTPVEAIARQRPYKVPRAATPVDLWLDGNEGAPPPDTLLKALADVDGEGLRRYPSTESLRDLLSEHVGVERHQLLVTAGADDAIDRVCRAVLTGGRNMVVMVPTFAMIPRFAELTGAEVRAVEGGDEGFPTEKLLAAADDATALIALVSPNNPTGVAISSDDIERIAGACPQALVMVDHAYGEFGGDDFTRRAPTFDNVVVTRTLSKAWGLAGLRVGYAVADEARIQWLATAGKPYAVAHPSTLIAARWLREGQDQVAEFVSRVAQERRRLHDLFDELSIPRSRSVANFVFARVGDGRWWRDAMAGFGIGVRAFPNRRGLEDAMRIACPGDEASLSRVEHAIRTIARPQALLLDVDGVMVDVSRSYRRAIVETAAHFGAEVDEEAIAAAKQAGDANNDWEVTRRLLADRGIEVSLAEVTRVFEEWYQGTDERRGLWREESLWMDAALLERLREKGLALGIVTGRPRADARRFLDHFGLEDYFSSVVCMEDGPNKPHPAPVEQAMAELNVERAWFVGDTPDDMRAARGAAALPLGVVAPGHEGEAMEEALLAAGGAMVLERLEELEDLMEGLP